VVYWGRDWLLSREGGEIRRECSINGIGVDWIDGCKGGWWAGGWGG